jgi:hypothetical protein
MRAGRVPSTNFGDILLERMGLCEKSLVDLRAMVPGTFAGTEDCTGIRTDIVAAAAVVVAAAAAAAKSSLAR